MAHIYIDFLNYTESDDDVSGIYTGAIYQVLAALLVLAGEKDPQNHKVYFF